MEQISIDLKDSMTVGSLRALARGVGKHLVISFTDGAPRNGRRARKAGVSAAPANGRRRRRKLSPEVRAKLAENLKRARAVRSAKAKARARKAKREKKAAPAREATA